MKMTNLVLAGVLILGAAVADAADCRIIIPSKLAAVQDAKGKRVADVLQASARSLGYSLEVIRGLSTEHGGFIEQKLAPGREGEVQASQFVSRIEALNKAAKKGIVYMLGPSEVADSDDENLIHVELTAAQVESIAAEGKDFLDEETLVLGEVTTRTDVETGILMYSSKQVDGVRSAAGTRIAPVDQMIRGLSQVLPSCQ